MRPFIIGIGGAHSGCGKTAAACAVLERLRGWGAVKCTPTLLYTSVADGPDALRGGDKDTARFIDAGASEALWVQSTAGDMEETLGMAVDRLSHLRGVVVEGNSAIEVLKPDIVIFISGEPGREKPSAAPALGAADIVIFGTEPPEGASRDARIFHRDDRAGYLDRVSEAVDGRNS
jgi:hypothetical protein